jgi:chemotaxis protein MotA
MGVRGLDIGVAGGLFLAVAALLGADLIDGGHLAALLNPSAALLIFGGTIGATAVSSQLSDLIALPRLLLSALRPKTVDLHGAIEKLVALALRARRNGLLSLEEDIAGLDDPFLAHGLQMVIDGADAETVRSVLRTDMLLRGQAAGRQAQLFETAGGFAPTMGIIGTVLGLIHVLSNLSSPGSLGPAIATAFLATFYGISSANIFWLPLGSKLRQNARQASLAAEVALEGILSIQAGDNPSAVRDKLAVFLQDARPKAGPAAEPEPVSEPARGGSGSGRVA